MRAYGIDFGTTNSAVSVNDAGRVTILPIGIDGSTFVPTYLYFSGHNDHVRVGDVALSEYVANGFSGRFIRSLKTCLPSASFRGTFIHGMGFCSVEQLVAFVLRDLKQRADRCVCADVKTLVLGRPVKFSEDEALDQLAEKRLRDAAALAGFEDVKLVAESTAAAYFYRQTLSAPQTVLIADLGGGTSDFTLVKLSPPSADAPADEVMGIHGVYVGGDLFDKNLCRHGLGDLLGADAEWHIHGKTLPMPKTGLNYAAEWHQSARLLEREIDAFFDQVCGHTNQPEAMARLECILRERLGFSLSRAVEKAKIELSLMTQTEFVFDHPVAHMKKIFTQRMFAHATAELVKRIMGAAHTLLTRVQYSPSQIDAVFLTGGTAKVPSVVQAFVDDFGHDKIKTGENFLAVAHGLGFFHNSSAE